MVIRIQTITWKTEKNTHVNIHSCLQGITTCSDAREVKYRTLEIDATQIAVIFKKCYIRILSKNHLPYITIIMKF